MKGIYFLGILSLFQNKVLIRSSVLLSLMAVGLSLPLCHMKYGLRPLKQLPVMEIVSEHRQ